MNTQDIVNLARTRGYTDSTQLTDPFAVLCLSMLYKDCRSRLNQFVAEDFATDTFNIPMILGQNTYSIPVGMDQVVSATVDYYPSGQSYPVRMGIRRFSSLPNAPDYYLLRQALTDPFYVIWGTQLKIYPQPQTLAYTFTVSGVTVSPSPGNTYTNNSGTFRILSVSITAGSGTIVAIPINTIVPTASGTLVRTSGVGDASITFSASAATSGVISIYANTSTDNLTISSSNTQIVGLPENLQKAMVTGLTAYFFESRGQYDKAEYFWKKYEEDIAMGIKTSNERDMAPIKRENNHFAQFQ